jgi:hypothetical protein
MRNGSDFRLVDKFNLRGDTAQSYQLPNELAECGAQELSKNGWNLSFD